MIVTLLLVTATLALAFVIYGHHPIARFRLRHIPGPPFVPFKGSVDAIVAAGGLHAAYDAWAAQYGPVFKVFLGAEPVVVVTDPVAARSAMTRLGTRAPSRARSPAEVPYVRGAAAVRAADMLHTPDVALHRELKKAWLPFFNADTLAANVPSIERVTARLAARLAAAADAGREVNLVELASDWTADLVFKLAFSVDLGAQADAQPPATADLLAAIRLLFATQQRASICYTLYTSLPPPLRPLVRAVATLAPDAALRRVTAARRTLFRYMEDLVAAAHKRAALGTATAPGPGGGRAMPTGAFLDHLVAARLKLGPGPPRRMTDVELVQAAVILTVAAFDSTANTLSCALYNLARAPDVAEAVAAEAAAALDAHGGVPADAVARMPLVTAVIHETMRLYPPGAIITRLADGVVAPCGLAVPRGTPLHFTSWTMHRDVRVWGADAAAFRPDRFLRDGKAAMAPAYIPFGTASSSLACIGKRLAMLELMVGLAKIVAGAGLRFDLSPGQVPLQVSIPLTLGPAHGVFITPRRVGKASRMAAEP